MRRSDEGNCKCKNAKLPNRNTLVTKDRNTFAAKNRNTHSTYLRILVLERESSNLVHIRSIILAYVGYD